MERTHLTEKSKAQVTFPGGLLPLCSKWLSSVPGHPCTPEPRVRWGWHRLVCPFWFEIPQLAGSKGCWSRSNLSQSCEGSSAGCKRSSRLSEDLNPLVLRVLESRVQPLARGERGQSRRVSWSWWRRGFPGAETTEPRSFRT